MDTIKIQPTELAEWYELIREAERVADISLEEALESYLVMLLMRFAKDNALADSILGMEYLEAQEQSILLQRDQLQTVGDKCLLYSGLFPSSAERKRVKVSYFVDLGRSAYYQVSGIVPTQLQPLYVELCQTFVKMRDILQTTRELVPENNHSLSQLAAIELWQDTGSRSAFKTMSDYTNSTTVQVTTRRKQ